MRIYSLAHILAAPFIIAFVVIGYLYYVDNNYDLSYWLLPLTIIIALIYVFMPQINFWWIKRNPPPLDQKIKQILLDFSPFYNQLNRANQQKFEDRLSIFLEGKEFLSMGSEQIGMPDDMKAILGHQAIILTFYRDDFMFDKYERLVLYKHPFPSPQFQFLHTVETEHEDGVFLWSMEHAIPGITRPTEFYNIILHGYIEAFLYRNKDLNFPIITEKHIPQLELISGFTNERVLGIIGFAEVNPLLLAINYFFTFPEKFEQFLPVASKGLTEIFKTSKITSPV